ncbi:MAG: GNAT family N-acetyltransferase [Steroidobacteraceae bacterium]
MTADRPDCLIRACVPADEAALALVGQATFLEAFAGTLRGCDIAAHCERAHHPQIYRAWLQDVGTRAWVAETAQGAAPVGYAVLTAADLPLADIAPHDLEIKRVYLLHRFQGMGLGRRLMDTARQHAEQRGARRLLLGVYRRNTSALGFYRALGYRPVGSRTFRVGATDCEDLILALPLTAQV